MNLTKHDFSLKFIKTSLITAILFSGFTLTQLNAEDKIYTEDGYMTKEEIKEINWLDSVEEAPLEIEFVPYSYGGDVGPKARNAVTYAKQGFVYPNHTKANGTTGDDIINIYPTSTGTSRISSISNNVIMTGVIPFVDATETRYRILVSGADGWVDKKYFNESLLDTVKSFNYYYLNSNNNLIHNIAYQAVCTTSCNYGVIDNGPAPSYLAQGNHYVSFDGHYFYEISKVPLMLQDYFNNVRTNAINPNDPYYNYYQFLPYRAMTNYSADTLEKYLSDKGYTQYADTNDYNVVTKNSQLSKLKDQGKSFFGHGVNFTLNPILTFGIAVNESGWGRSAISVTKNNIFGHGAVDASPNDAYLFASVDQSIYEIYTPTFNWGYVDSDPTTYTNYNGSYLGDKAGGFNVMYASDPYWGQKAARTYYEIDRLYGSLDYQKSTVGITKSQGVVKVYLEPKLNSPYKYPKGSSSSVDLTYRNDASILVLEEVQGETINGSNLWYKVRSDFMMTADRKPTPVASDKSHRKLPYLDDTSFYYIHASDVTLISKGSVIVTPHPDEETPQPPTPPAPTYKLGDVNNDGSIDVSDILAIRRHILNVKPISGDATLAADVNKDKAIDVSDILGIRRHILGVKPIQ